MRGYGFTDLVRAVQDNRVGASTATLPPTHHPRCPRQSPESRYDTITMILESKHQTPILFQLVWLNSLT